MLRILEIATGAVLAGLTLLDVFETVVVPGAMKGWLRLAQRVRVVSLPLWRRRASRGDGPLRIPRGLAPFVFTATFSLWMCLLCVAYGLMLYGLRDHFRPVVESLPEAVFTAGLGVVTTGLSGREAVGAARWVVLASGVSGLAVMTMAVTYILQVQNGLERRDAALAKLSTVAGRPPTGVAILETHAALGCCAELGPFFREWRDWSAAVLHSHSSQPVLAYFRSLSAEMDWPVALGAVLDAACLHSAFVGGEDAGAAMLLHRDGARLTASLARLFGVEEGEARPVEPAEVSRLLDRLEAAGYAPRRDRACCERFLVLRGDYQARLDGLSEHFGVADTAVLARHRTHVSDYRD